MFKVTNKMLDKARTRKGSFTVAQAKIMLNIYGKGWIKKLLACDDFCPAIWEKFKSSNISQEDLQRQKKKKDRKAASKTLNSLDTGKFNEISCQIENTKDVVRALNNESDLKALRDHAGGLCVGIYKDFYEEEINKFPPSIQKAWKTGRKIEENLTKLLSK